MYEELPLSVLASHPLNANRISRMYAKKLRQSIASDGYYETLTVRPHPSEGNTFEVLNGHVRMEILRELGVESVKCDVWDVDDKQAIHYLAVLNKLRGSDSSELRMQLLFEMLQHETKEELALCIPETESYLDKLEKLPDTVEKTQKKDHTVQDNMVIMHFYITKEQYATVMQALDLVAQTFGLKNSSEALFKLSLLYMNQN